MSTKKLATRSCSIYPLPENEMRCTEDLHTSDGAVAEILSYEVIPSMTEVRVQNGSVLCKGEYLITVFCVVSDENDTLSYQTLSKRTPFTEIHDDDRIRDTFCCEPDITVSDISCTVTEEGRVVGIDFNVTASAVCYEETHVPVITDAFLPSYDVRIQSEERSVFLPNRMLFGNMAVSGQIKYDSAEKPHSVTDCAGHIVFERTELTQKRICAIGYIDVSSILQTEDQHYIPVNGTVPIRWECDIPTGNQAMPSVDPSQLICHAEGAILNTGCKIDTEQHCIVFDAETALSISAAIKTQTSVPTSVCVPPDAKKIPPSPCPVVLYFPQEGEAIWNIAKQHRVSPALLCEYNSFPADTATVPSGTHVMLIQASEFI